MATVVCLDVIKFIFYIFVENSRRGEEDVVPA